MIRMLNKRNANESGVILVTVVVLTIVLSIVAIGVMSLNVSQIKTSTSVVKTIVAEQLATGLFYQDYQRRVEQRPIADRADSETIGTTTYSVSWAADIENVANRNNTNQVQFNLTYN